MGDGQMKTPYSEAFRRPGGGAGETVERRAGRRVEHADVLRQYGSGKPGAEGFGKGFLGTENAGGGLGGKITPNAVLVIKDGQCKLVSVKSTDVVSKVIDMVPGVIDKFKKSPKDKENEKEMVKKGEEFLNEQGKE